MILGVGAFKVGGAGQCSSIRRRYPWQPYQRKPPPHPHPPPPRHRHTEQFSGILTDPILTQPTPRGREGWEKPKHKLARKKQAIATTVCEELQASNCVYKSRGASARGIGPPLLWLGKQLTSIASRLTLPKLHLATFK